MIQPRAGGHLEVVEELRLPLRLGAALDDDGRLSEAAYERLASAVEDFLAISRAAGSERIVAVGTSALRDATNGGEFLDRLRERFGLEIRIIDGALEAHYGFLGAVHGLPIEHGMLIDIGGGSVEFARFRDREVEDLWSFPLGTLRAGGRFFRDDPPTEEQVEELREATASAIADAGMPRLRRDEQLIGTGGAIRNVAKIDRRRRSRRYPVPRLHGYEMRRGRVTKVGNVLRATPSSERGAISGLNPGRAETIVAGVTVLESIMGALKARSLVVSGQGLREGVVRATLGDLPPTPVAETLASPLSVRQASVRALTARFASIDEAASERRAWIALEVIDRAEAAVGAQLRELIGYAPALIEAGAAIDFYNREEVAAEIVMQTDLAGFSHLMVAELAALLLLVEEPDFEVRRFAPLLSADERGGLEIASAAVALAIELSRRMPPAAIGTIGVTVSKQAITLRLPGGTGTFPAELRGRIERAFGRELRTGSDAS